MKLAVYDFINLIGGPYSDETANLAYIAPKLKDLANEAEVLIISLAQVARAKGGPNTPLKDSRVAKGSSAIEESATVVMGVWREGYNTEQDDFITLAGLKMRMGREFKLDLHWNGANSEIREMNPMEVQRLDEFRAAKESEEEGSSWGSRKKPSWD
jgi:replicative DNA helicase